MIFSDELDALEAHVKVTKTEPNLRNTLFRSLLVDFLTEGVCKVTFTKKDGSERIMNATLHPSWLPQPEIKEEEGVDKVPNYDIITVWDIDKDDWRAFRLDSLKTFNGREV